VAALRTATGLDLVLHHRLDDITAWTTSPPGRHHRLEDLEARTDAEGEQSLFELAGELTHGDAHGIGDTSAVSCAARPGSFLTFFDVVRPAVPAHRTEVW